MLITSSFTGWGGSGMARAHMSILVLDQSIPDWPIKVTFLGKVETAIRPIIKYRFCTMGFSMSDTILSLWFSVLQPLL